MAMSLFNGRRSNSLLDPFWSESPFGPFELSPFAPSRSFGDGFRAVAGTKVDWLESDNTHVIKVDLPGLKREDIKVELEDRTLSISGERSVEEEKKGDTWHTVERSHGKFLRQFKLPRNAEVDSLSAKVEDGVLTVTVPKLPEKESEKRSIAVA